MTATEPAAAPTTARERAALAVSAVTDLLQQCERPDLDARLSASTRRLADATCTVLVVGEFKKGKSSLLNALVRGEVCPVDDDVATAKPIELFHSVTPVATIVLQPADPGYPVPVVRSIRPEDVPAYTTEPPKAPDAAEVMAVRVGLDSALLSAGLVLVDTPGVGGLGSTHSATTIGALPGADAVLFVTDASQELTASELEFLRTVRQMCPTVVCVLTKIDFYPAWRKIMELNEGHLQRHGVDCRIFATSAPIRQLAVARSDRQLNNESGYNALVTFLRQDLAARIERATVGRLAAELTDVVDHLEAQLRAELQVLEDPEESAKLLRQLEAAKERSERLRSQAARWQQTLNDGFGDLNADVEHDLRYRFRELVRQAEEAVESFDPAHTWDEFEPWLTRAATTQVVQNYAFLHQRATQLAAQVATHFEADVRDVVTRLEINDPSSITASADMRASLKVDRPSNVSLAISAMRNTSGGMLMLSAFGGLAGVAVAPPVAAMVGLMIGRKAVKDEKHRQLLQRRMLAKQAVRKYTDEVQFAMGKDSRDTLRRINRQLRDHFLSRAEELNASMSESLAATQQALRSSEQSRTQRRKDVVALLQRVAVVRTALGATGEAA